MKKNSSKQLKNRRSAGVLGESKLFADGSGTLPKGDLAILKFVAAAELIETDLWVQYAELGGVTTSPLNPYQLAFQNLDSDALHTLRAILWTS